MKVLANDGLTATGIAALQVKGFDVLTTKIPQDEIASYINQHNITVLLVRSATKVTRDIIDQCPSLQIIGRGGVGMDNIEVEYARARGIHVINTPAASSESVAELVFAHLFSGCRFLYDSNRKMPVKGQTDFEQLKKSYAKGVELRNKTIGIVGFGKIGQEVARMALGLGMKVIAADTTVGKASIRVDFYNAQFINVEIETEPFDQLLQHSDFVTLHVPAQERTLIGASELALMKVGSAIINCARGGLIEEVALIDALDSGRLAFAGLDVFEGEPQPSLALLSHPKISLTPHTGAATLEAQDRIGLSLAAQIASLITAG